MIKISNKGSFNNIDNFFKNMSKKNHINILEKYAKEGVKALSDHTPKDSGETANSWSYTISNKNGVVLITWNNSNIVNEVPVAILIQYGHATGNGGYVQGVDYINPALQPIFDKIVNDIWMEVTK